MQALAVESVAPRLPVWLQASSVLGILWNLYGIYQYVGTFTLTGQAAMTAGMTASQVQNYLSLPTWITSAFAVGVFGGLVGSILLLLRRRFALSVFAASLVGYGLLFAGDAYHGVFAAKPSQIVILGFVVLIAALLVWASWLADRRGLLG